MTGSVFHKAAVTLQFHHSLTHPDISDFACSLTATVHIRNECRQAVISSPDCLLQSRNNAGVICVEIL